MAEYLIQDSTLTSIANAIREKTGSTDAIATTEFAEAIIGIQSGGGVQLEGDFLKYVVYQLDDGNKEIKIYGILWSNLYTDTKKYDVTIPSSFGEYKVVIASEGVV